MTDVAERLKGLLVMQLNTHADLISGASTVKSLGGDSLDAIEVAMDIEEEFDVEFPDYDELYPMTFDEMVAKIIELS